MRRILAALTIYCALAAAAPEGAARYFIVFLRPDPARKPLAKEDGDRIMAAHMANIHKMADDGVLIAAGPFEDTPVTISGIFVFRMESLAAARALAESDPTVVAHRNVVEAHAWMGTPGIGEEYRRIHKQDPATPDKMEAHPLCLLYHGPAWEEKAASRDAVMGRHGAYIGQLRDRGKLGAAGWIEDPGDLAGMVVFQTIPREEAESLLKDDPAVREGLLRIETHRWWSADRVLPW